MRLSQLRPCDNCGGPIAPIFYLLNISQAIISPHAANQVLGLNAIFHGNLRLAEVMAPNENPVIIMGEQDSQLWTQLYICQECMLERKLFMANLIWKEED